jgi:hypothetical protein
VLATNIVFFLFAGIILSGDFRAFLRSAVHASPLRRTSAANADLITAAKKWTASVTVHQAVD